MSFDTTTKSFLDSDVADDPCTAANAPVPDGFAGFSSVTMFIGNAGLNNRKFRHVVDQPTNEKNFSPRKNELPLTKMLLIQYIEKQRWRMHPLVSLPRGRRL